MGLAATTFRIMYLKSYENQLNNQIQAITETKLGMTESIGEMTAVGQDRSPDSPAVKQLQQRKEKLAAMDKKLDMRLQMLTSQLKMVQTEIQSATAMQDQQIKSSFSY